MHQAVYFSVFVAAAAVAGYFAYDIRLFAIREFGPVIHEFDVSSAGLPTNPVFLANYEPLSCVS